MLLVFLSPSGRAGRVTALRYGTGALIAAMGISRILLGVRYLSDVVGAWALGIAWLGVSQSLSNSSGATACR